MAFGYPRGGGQASARTTPGGGATPATTPCTPWPVNVNGSVVKSTGEERLRGIFDNLLGLALAGLVTGPLAAEELAEGLRHVGFEAASRSELQVFVRTVEKARHGQVSFADFLEEVQKCPGTDGGPTQTFPNTSSTSFRRASAPVPAGEDAAAAKGVPLPDPRTPASTTASTRPRRSTVDDASTAVENVRRSARVNADLSLVQPPTGSSRHVRESQGRRRATKLESDSSMEDSPRSSTTGPVSSFARRSSRTSQSTSARKSPSRSAPVEPVITIDDPHFNLDDEPLSGYRQADRTLSQSMSRKANLSILLKDALEQLARLREAVPASRGKSTCKELEALLSVALQHGEELEGRVVTAEAEIAKSRELAERGFVQLQELVTSSARQHEEITAVREDAEVLRAELEAANAQIDKLSRPGPVREDTDVLRKELEAANARIEAANARIEKLSRDGAVREDAEVLRMDLAAANARFEKLSRDSKMSSAATLLQCDWLITKRARRHPQVVAFLALRVAVVQAKAERHAFALAEHAANAQCAAALRRRLRSARASAPSLYRLGSPPQSPTTVVVN